MSAVAATDTLPKMKARHRSRAESVAVWLLLFAIVLSLQLLAGAYGAELSAYPDEASHYMSGLLVRDFLADHLPVSPVKYAGGFYLKYPYIAIGHWPPVFYALEGVWMLLFTPSRVSVLLLMAIITTALGGTTYQVLHREFGRFSSLAAAVLLVCLPVVQRFASAVMLDVLVALLSLWAALRFGRFLDTGRWQAALQFAALASLAILTKGNGFALALVPPLAILFSRRFSLLKQRAFWLAGLTTAALSVPWTLLTFHMVTPTWGERPSLSFPFRAFGSYAGVLWQSAAPAIFLLALVGFYVRVVGPFAARRVESKWAAVASLFLGVLVFQSLVPAGIEPRFLIPALPPLLMFFAAGAAFLAQQLRFRAIHGARVQVVVVVLAALVFARYAFVIPKKTSYGLKEAVEQLEQRPDFRNALMLISSETTVGEGILVSEIAMRIRGPGQMILRASKVLSQSDWRNSNYQPRYSTAAALFECMKTVPVDYIVLDAARSGSRYEHHRQLLEIVTGHPDRWRFLGAHRAGLNPAGSSGSVYVYQAVGRPPATERRTLPASIATNLGGRSVEWPVWIRFSCDAGRGDLRSETGSP